MSAYPDQVDRAFALTSLSKYLERIADHAVTVAQRVVFVVTGQHPEYGDTDA